jgi:hypothetical protein
MSTYSLSEIEGLWPSISCNIVRYPFADFYNSTLGNFVFSGHLGFCHQPVPAYRQAGNIIE